MLFGRKTPASKGEKLRIMLWPRRSWSRSAKYMSKRILRLTASPHAIAAGVAAGVLASFTPFLGFHFLIAFAVAFIIGGNFLAAAMGTFFGNPLTFPLIWASTHQLGSFILSGERSHSEGKQLGAMVKPDFYDVGLSGLFHHIIGIWDPLVKPMLVGSIPLGIMMGIIGYVVTRWASSIFNAARKQKRATKLNAALEMQKRSKPEPARID